MATDSSSTWINALIGAVVTIVLSFTMVSPILGGMVAGYLERSEGIRVGTIAGVIAAIPVLLLMFIAIMMFGFFMGFAGMMVAFLPFIAAFFLLAYIIGLSALGGYLGVYLRHEV